MHLPGGVEARSPSGESRSESRAESRASEAPSHFLFFRDSTTKKKTLDARGLLLRFLVSSPCFLSLRVDAPPLKLSRWIRIRERRIEKELRREKTTFAPFSLRVRRSTVKKKPEKDIFFLKEKMKFRVQATLPLPADVYFLERDSAAFRALLARVSGRIDEMKEKESKGCLSKKAKKRSRLIFRGGRKTKSPHKTVPADRHARDRRRLARRPFAVPRGAGAGEARAFSRGCGRKREVKEGREGESGGGGSCYSCGNSFRFRLRFLFLCGGRGLPIRHQAQHLRLRPREGQGKVKRDRKRERKRERKTSLFVHSLSLFNSFSHLTFSP